MTLDFSVVYVYDFGVLSQNLRPCHMGKCHVGSKADMAGKKRHKMNFWPAKAHIEDSLFMGHKLFFGLILPGALFHFCFFGPYFQPIHFSPYNFLAHII
jgi:hypothetical protein